jgi:hypothetical protein
MLGTAIDQEDEDPDLSVGLSTTSETSFDT